VGALSSARMSRLPLLVASLLACALLLGACGDDEEKAASTATATATPADTPEPAQAAGCEKVSRPKPRKAAKLPKPKEELKSGKTYVARVLTNCGEFEITLDPKRAPRTGGSFKYLADKRFFDGLGFHRIVPGFVIQGGDPSGNGSGGPGYSVTEAPPPDLAYTKGVVAMAKTGTEPAGTSGSQFFVVTGEDVGLPPDYALLGKVTKGQDVVDKIGVVAVGPDEQPTDPVVIRQIRVTES
jgi:peptidyl-prolyl cis-trans isomerase B (cyclophilin B)